MASRPMGPPTISLRHNHLNYIQKSESEYVQYLYKSIEVDPDGVRNHLLLSRKLKNLGKTNESINHLRTAINPDYAVEKAFKLSIC